MQTPLTTAGSTTLQLKLAQKEESIIDGEG
jgi:hypothetical protein